VLPRLVATTRPCAYERAGLERRNARRPRRPPTGSTSLLDRARIKSPYVLVGHSYGGLLAHEHPDSIAGVILVDAMGRDETRRQLAVWPKSQAIALRRYYADPVVDGVACGPARRSPRASAPSPSRRWS
jgi:pimeloyl-ACP methyl ester carboxylesterase